MWGTNVFVCMCYALKRKLFANIACLALLSYVCGWPKRMFTIYRNIREYSRTYGKYTASAPCLSLYICCMSLYSFHILLLFGWRVERQYGDWCKCERVFVCEYARGEPADINLSWAHNNQTIATACAYIQRNIVLLFDVAIGCISACLSVCLRVLSSPEHAVTGHLSGPDSVHFALACSKRTVSSAESDDIAAGRMQIKLAAFPCILHIASYVYACVYV